MGATGKAAWLANQGAAGVYLFFVLSGYLACCDRKLPTAGKKELLTYYKKRLVRILPLYYGVILYNILLHADFKGYSGRPAACTGFGIFS